METALPNIYQRMNEVRKKVEYLKKNKTVQGYKAVEHDQVTSEIRPYLIENGIITVIRQSPEFKLEPTGTQTKTGTPFTRFIGFYEINFVNMDDPKDKVTYTTLAMAEDHGDKGPGKSTSYAMKNTFLKAFNIETGESDESRQDQKPSHINTEQLTIILDLLDEAQADINRFNKAFKIKQPSELLASQYLQAETQLKKQIAVIKKKKEPNA